MKLLALLVGFPLFAKASLPPPVPIRPEVKAHLLQAARRELPASVKLSVQSISLSATAPKEAALVLLSPHPPVGLVNFELIWQETNLTRRAYGTALLSAQAPVAVVSTPLRFGEPLNSSNVVFQPRELTPYLVAGYFRSWEEVSQRRAAGSLRPGEVLTPGNTQVPAPVTAGQMLDLVHELGNLKITARVKALEGGRLNEWIRVENPSSRKVLQARVSAAGEVRLH